MTKAHDQALTTEPWILWSGKKNTPHVATKADAQLCALIPNLGHSGHNYSRAIQPTWQEKGQSSCIREWWPPASTATEGRSYPGLAGNTPQACSGAGVLRKIPALVSRISDYHSFNHMSSKSDPGNAS